MWKIDGPQGQESAKIRFDIMPYVKGRILDLGCGPEKVFPIAIGVDNKIDAKLFGIKVTPDVAVDTCAHLEVFADACAETVVSSHLLEHFPYEDVPAVLKEWFRLLSVGGHLILYVPNNEDSIGNGGYPKVGETGANPDHRWDVTYDLVIEALKTVGSWDLVQYEKRSKDREYSFLFILKKTDDGEHRLSYLEPKPKPEKTLGLVRLGAYGDALWISPLLPHWKAEGYHITLYAHPQAEEVLRHDPHIDRIICQPHGIFDFGDGRVAMWQTAYWLHEEKKYDKFVNLIGGVERRYLPQPFDPDFYLPQEQRHRLMNRNYAEVVCEWAGVPFNKIKGQRFYPSDAELQWALLERSTIDGPLVLINPSGSSLPKWWPHTQKLVDLLAAEGVHTRIVGDLRGTVFTESTFCKMIGTKWPIRKVFTLAAMAEAVVGTESALVNAVAFEEVLKVVLLSHSTHENLTRDWINAIAVEPEGLACYPCHRIHSDMTHCTYDRELNCAACQGAATAEFVAEHLLKYLRKEDGGRGYLDRLGQAA